MGASSDYPGPGLHVVRDAHPVRRARIIAERLRAVLCTTAEEAARLVAAYTEEPRVDGTTLARLRALAGRMARAERIAARTHDRAVADVGTRLAGTAGGVAMHPETVRERASAVVDAETELVAAERALEAEVQNERAQPRTAADRSVAADGSFSAPSPPLPPSSPSPSVHRAGPSVRARRARAIGVLLAAFGQLVLVSLDAVPLLAALTLPLLAGFWASWYLRPREEPVEDSHAAVSSSPAEVGSSTDERFARLTAARDQAQERLRVAQRAWQDIAGADSDRSDLEAVLQGYDPQDTAASVLASETAGVRAAETVRHLLEVQWEASWREVGLPVPRPADGQAAVAELTARLTRAIVLVGPATERATELAELVPAAPVVVVEVPSVGN